MVGTVLRARRRAGGSTSEVTVSSSVLNLKSAKANDYGFAGLDQATRDLAAAEQVALVDTTKLTFDYYTTLPDKSVVFATSSEGTHFSEHGATEVSRLVAAYLKTSTLTLKALLK